MTILTKRNFVHFDVLTNDLLNFFIYNEKNTVMYILPDLYATQSTLATLLPLHFFWSLWISLRVNYYRTFTTFCRKHWMMSMYMYTVAGTTPQLYNMDILTCLYKCFFFVRIKVKYLRCLFVLFEYYLYQPLVWTQLISFSLKYSRVVQSLIWTTAFGRFNAIATWSSSIVNSAHCW